MITIIDVTVQKFLKEENIEHHIPRIEKAFAKIKPNAKTIRIVGARETYSGVNAQHKSVSGSRSEGKIFKSELGFELNAHSHYMLPGYIAPITTDAQENRFEMVHSRPFSTGGNSTQIFIEIE